MCLWKSHFCAKAFKQLGTLQEYAILWLFSRVTSDMFRQIATRDEFSFTKQTRHFPLSCVKHVMASQVILSGKTLVAQRALKS